MEPTTVYLITTRDRVLIREVEYVLIRTDAFAHVLAPEVDPERRLVIPHAHFWELLNNKTVRVEHCFYDPGVPAEQRPALVYYDELPQPRVRPAFAHAETTAACRAMLAEKNRLCRAAKPVNPAVPLETNRLALDMARRYADPRKPTMAALYHLLLETFSSKNAARRTIGLPPLRTPSRRTFERMIRGLDPHAVAMARYGQAARTRTYAKMKLQSPRRPR